MFKNKKFWLIFLLIFTVGIFITTTNVVHAGIFDENVTEACVEYGDCTVCDALSVLHAVARFVFGSMAGIAMIWILWASTGMIFNWGNAEAMAGAKRTILHTFLAILLIMTAYALVGLLYAFYLQPDFSKWDSKVWSGAWVEGPKCQTQTNSTKKIYTGGSSEYGPAFEYLGPKDVGTQNCASSWETGRYSGPSCGGDPGCYGLKYDIDSHGNQQCRDASPQLQKLLICIYENQKNYSDLNGKLILTSISHNTGLKQCRDNWSSACQHSRNSCHFGGPASNTDGSYAADFRSAGISSDTNRDHFKQLVEEDCAEFYGQFNDERDEDEPHYHISHAQCGGL